MGVCFIALTGCSLNNNAKTSESMNESQYSQITKQETTTTTTQKITLEDTNQGDFSMVTSDGAYHIEDGIYTIYKGGTYVLSGVLEGQICVCVTEANSDNSYDLSESKIKNLQPLKPKKIGCGSSILHILPNYFAHAHRKR